MENNNFITKEGIIMYKADDIANWFLNQLHGITNKKLQKLVYYAYSWYLVFNNESADEITVRFFDNKFEAWVHGAVYPDLYEKYKIYGSGNIPSYTGTLADFSEDDTDLLNQIVEVYGKFNGNQLEDINHQESPWRSARVGLDTYDPSHNPITDKLIFECYSRRLENAEG